MRVFRSLTVLLAVLAMTGVAETSFQQRAGGAGQRGVGAGGQRGVPPPGGRRGVPPDGQRRGGRGASANVARIEARTYIFPETSEEIEYDIFVSTKVDKKNKSPLVIALHGLGVPPATWLRLIVDAAQDAGYIVAAPMGYNVHGWYGANGPASGQAEIPNLGELSERDVMNVLELVRKDFNVDERRIYLLGQSMGGAGALFLGVKHKDIWAAVGASAPAVRPRWHSPSDLEQAPGMPMILVQGDADQAVPVEQTRLWAEKMKSLKMTYEYHELPGVGHSDAIAKGAPAIFKFFDKHVKPGDR
jgi:predicted peptidase